MHEPLIPFIPQELAAIVATCKRLGGYWAAQAGATQAKQQGIRLDTTEHDDDSILVGGYCIRRYVVVKASVLTGFPSVQRRYEASVERMDFDFHCGYTADQHILETGLVTLQAALWAIVAAEERARFDNVAEAGWIEAYPDPVVMTIAEEHV